MSSSDPITRAHPIAGCICPAEPQVSVTRHAQRLITTFGLFDGFPQEWLAILRSIIVAARKRKLEELRENA